MPFNQHGGILIRTLQEFGILFQDGDGIGTNGILIVTKEDVGQT